MKSVYDLTIIGGGIIGLAIARKVSLRHPKLRVCVLEKEKELGCHQTKRNSGVVHCGIYYKKGSLKSKFCIKGASLIEQYCKDNNLQYNKCGKLIVATKQHELDTLHNLFKVATDANICDIRMISGRKAESIQPGCSNTIEAIWSPNTAIVDWHQVASSFAAEFEQRGGIIMTNFKVSQIKPSCDGYNTIEAERNDDPIRAKSIVTCAGVYSDYFARQTGNSEHPKVVPFKGNYYMLSDRLTSNIRTNIYPVPNPKFPFLGVHITPRVDGTVLIGPTSLLTLGYEKYDTNIIWPSELYHILFRSGLKKMLRNKANLSAGINELMRYYSKERFLKEVKFLYPKIKLSDLIDTKFCGIRAQVVSKEGHLVDDFLFETGLLHEYNRVLHLRNCPSPAATSSLAISERVVDILEDRLI